MSQLEEETEQEAIELIQALQTQVDTLKTHLACRDQEILDLKASHSD